MILTEILSSIPNLEPEELQKVVTRCKSHMQFSDTATTAKKTSAKAPLIRDNYLLDGVTYELSKRGLVSRSAKIPFNRIAKDCVERALEVQEYLEGHIKNKLRTEEKAALGRLAAELLAQWLEQATDRPPSPKMMLTNIGKIPLAIDHAFPGYLKSGLLPWAWGSHGGR